MLVNVLGSLLRLLTALLVVVVQCLDQLGEGVLEVRRLHELLER